MADSPTYTSVFDNLAIAFYEGSDPQRRDGTRDNFDSTFLDIYNTSGSLTEQKRSNLSHGGVMWGPGYFQYTIERNFCREAFRSEFEFPGVEPPIPASLEGVAMSVQDLVRKYSPHAKEEQERAIKAYNDQLRAELQTLSEKVREIEQRLGRLAREKEEERERQARENAVCILVLKVLGGVLLAVAYVQVAYRMG
ncbi:hypothetical protein B0J14DRAFT_558140 [Halenospora varia]|nr:hypothetical protein B0J14DRAFT_558140 [Halenospora varia]